MLKEMLNNNSTVNLDFTSFPTRNICLKIYSVFNASLCYLGPALKICYESELHQVAATLSPCILVAHLPLGLMTSHMYPGSHLEIAVSIPCIFS